MYIVRWFVREIMFAYVLLCISSTVVRDTLGPYWIWLGRSGWSDGEPFVANSCDKLGRYCQICTTYVWKRCEICKLWRSCAACEHGIVFDVCQGGVQVFRNLSAVFEIWCPSNWRRLITMKRLLAFHSVWVYSSDFLHRIQQFCFHWDGSSLIAQVWLCSCIVGAGWVVESRPHELIDLVCWSFKWVVLCKSAGGMVLWLCNMCTEARGWVDKNCISIGSNMFVSVGSRLVKSKSGQVRVIKMN